ncbi:MAG: hypothetical protein KKB20_23050, partial [Proteobacteria bacterium]|nr:hypothetical protein [Pseudomonadota bacterium]
FRDDLYYRLNVLSILLPPLRERAEDIPLLAEHFLQQAPRPARISSQALRDLILWSWPGNVRELQNVIERGSVMCDDGLIQPSNLPENMSVQGPANPMASLSSAVPAPLHVDTEMNLDQALAEMEQAMIVESLWRTGGVQARAAELLGIKERSLWHRIKKYGIDVAAIRDDLRARNDE